MFAMSWYLAVVAIVIGGSVGYVVRKEGVTKDWGDSVAGLRFQLARDQLLALTEHSTFYHAKNWRPQLLVLVKTDDRCNPTRPELLEIASSLKKGQGLLIAYALIDAEAYGRALIADAATEVLRLHLQDHDIQGFPRAVVYRHRGSRAGTHIAAGDGHLVDAFEDLRLDPVKFDEIRTPNSKATKCKALIVDDRRALMDAMLSAAQSCGIGALRPNTVLLGWPTARQCSVQKDRPTSPSSDRARRVDFVQLLRDLSSMRKALILVKGAANLAPTPVDVALDETKKTIDVWWVVQDGGLLLLLPWLMQKSFGTNCRLRLFAVMTGLFAHHWNATHGGAEPVFSVALGDDKTEELLLRRFEAFVRKLITDLRIDATIHAVAGLDFVQAAAHVYRDTLGLRGRTTYLEQLTSRKGAHFHRSPRRSVSPKNESLTAEEKSPLQGSKPSLTLPEKVLNSFDDAGRVEDDDTTLFHELLGFAEALNGRMREHSSSASLIVTNLPYMTHVPPQFFVDYVDTMTDGLDSVMLIRGSGMEVVTKYG